MKFKMMYSFLNLDIDTVEKALEEAVYADSALLREASLHLLQAGGKRIRPLFALSMMMLLMMQPLEEENQPLKPSGTIE